MAHTFCGMIEGEKDNELSKPKGTNDILPGTSEKWQFVEETARLILKIINTKKSEPRFLNIMK